MQITNAVQYINFNVREQRAYNAGYEQALEDAQREADNEAALDELRKEIKRQRIIIAIKQKGLGIAALIITVLIPILLDGDATASILTLPMGMVMLFSHKIVIYDGSVEYLRELKKEYRALKEEREVAQW